MRRALQPHYQIPASRPTKNHPFWVVLLFLLSASLAGKAQTFSEPMSDSGVNGVSRETVTSYTNKGGFAYDALGTDRGTFVYSGNALIATTAAAASNNYPGASRGVSIFYGAPVNGTQVLPQNFNIRDINTSALGRVELTFGLYTYRGAAPVAGDFVVQYSANGGALTNLSYTRTTNFTAANNNFAWNLYTVTTSIPNVNSLAFNFVRTAQATAVTNNNKEFRLDDVTVNSLAKTIQLSTTALNFPNTAVNATSAPKPFTLTGSNLTDDVVVTAPSGFLVRIGTSSVFSQTVAVTPNAAGNASAIVEVQFAPTSNEAPNPPSNVSGVITVASVGADVTPASGIDVLGPATPAIPSLTSDQTSLSFGPQTVGTSSPAQSFQLEGQDLTSNVTVSAPAGYEIRVGNNPFSPNPITIPLVNKGVSATIDVRFVPGTTGAIAGNVRATAGSASINVAVSGSGSAAPSTPVINATPTTVAFGTVTNSGSAQVESFTVSATSLGEPLVLTPSVANIEIRNATAGGSFGSSVSITPNSFGNITNQTIEVRLVATVPINSFAGTITLSSANAANVIVNVTASNPSGGISDISLTNARLREFSTAPGVPSDIQSYNVSADNLLRNLTITAPQFFQISLTAGAAGFSSLGTNTGNSIVLTPKSGNADPTQNGDVDLTTIYVRYYPPGAQTNRGQVVSNSSSPARTQFVSVNGSSEPEVLVRGLFTSVTNQVKFTKSGVQTLTVVAARVRNTLTIRVPRDPEPSQGAESPLNPSRTPQFEISLTGNANDFSTQVTYTPDANDSIARRPLYVRYAPTRVGSALADLLFRTVDINSNVESDQPRVRLQGNSIAIEPTRQSAGTVTRSADRTSVTLVFTQEDSSPFPGNPEAAGFGQNRLIIASTSSTLGVGFFPQDAASYDPGNNRYGDGTQINGNYVVFASSAPTAVVTNLDPNVNYYFFGFEYNNDQVGGAENYKTPNLPVTVQLPLPVELVSFTAQLRNEKVNLNWVTASEKNNRGFEVQRSQNGQQFTTLLFKEGRGTTTARSTYEAVDERPFAGLSYYRLKQVDNDGKFSYSPVVIVKNAGLTEVNFYPNPTSGTLTISLPQAQAGVAQKITITDLAGRVVRAQTLPTTGEVNLSQLQSGTYLVTVGTGDQQVTRKVVKN